MEKIRSQLKNPGISAGIGLIVGLFIGLVVLGWGLWPLEWKDAAARDLRSDAKIDYLRMAIDSYTLRKDVLQAKFRWEELSPGAESLLAELQSNKNIDSKENVDQKAITEFTKAVQVNPSSDAQPIFDEEGQGQDKSQGLTWLIILFSIVVLALVVFAVFYFLRSYQRTKRSTGERHEDDFDDYPPESRDQAGYDVDGFAPNYPSVESRLNIRSSETTRAPIPQSSPRTASREETPIAQFMTNYNLGDDLYDDSFAIDSPSGEFLGECGVGISETIGIGEPKKAAALELWLFDKNDIQTVTKVLMSQQTFADQETRQRLMAKGEPVLVEPGTEITLETKTLILIARVIDMAYGGGATPPKSYFERITLELAMYRKR